MLFSILPRDLYPCWENSINVHWFGKGDWQLNTLGVMLSQRRNRTGKKKKKMFQPLFLSDGYLRRHYVQVLENLVELSLCCQAGGLSDTSLLLLCLLWLTLTSPSLLPLRSPSKLQPVPKFFSQTLFFGRKLKRHSTQIWGRFAWFNQSVLSIFFSTIYYANELLPIQGLVPKDR